MRLNLNLIFLFIIVLCVNVCGNKAIIAYCNKEFCIFNREDLNKLLFDKNKKNLSDFFDVIYEEKDITKKSSNKYREGAIANLNENTNTTENSLNDAGTIAAWVLLIMIIAPFILIMTIFILCCQYVFNWCKPRHHVYREYEPPLLIRPQPYPRYNPSSNFNA